MGPLTPVTPSCSQAAIQRRDEEIARLSARLEAAKPGEAEALGLRAQRQAESIMQLHARLEEAGSQLAALGATAERVAAAEATAQQAGKDQKVRLVWASARTQVVCADDCIDPLYVPDHGMMTASAARPGQALSHRRPSGGPRRRWRTMRPLRRRWSRCAGRWPGCRRSMTRRLRGGRCRPHRTNQRFPRYASMQGFSSLTASCVLREAAASSRSAYISDAT